MRKIYSLVLMAMVLLWSTNGRAAGPVAMLNGSQTFESVQAAIDAAQSGDKISLIDNVVTSAPLWLGTTGLDGEKKSLTLDLAGFSITSQADVLHTFVVSHGALKVLNSVPGQGGMYNTCAQDTSSAVFYLHGTWERGINPRSCAESDLYTFLTIEEGVNLYANGPQGSAIVVKEISDREASKLLLGLLYNTDVYWQTKSWTKGVANGVRVDVKGQISAQKYGVKVDGNIRYPNPDAECQTVQSQQHRLQNFPTLGNIQLADTAFVPYVHIYPSAVIDQANNNEYGTAVYASGYANWLIEGKCNGAIGLYVKSGVVTLSDAMITSTWEGPANDVVGTEQGSHGFEAGGQGIVVESTTGYSGETVLIVEGDSKIETGANGGAAMYEIVTTLDKKTKVDSIVVRGGSFTGGEDGYSMVISKETIEDPEADVIVYGTNITGGVKIGGVEDISDILAENTHTTVVNNSDGTATVIVSTGADAPQGVTNWAEVQSGADVNWLGSDLIAIESNLTLGELQMISGDVDHPQQLTVKENTTFVVDKLIMNEYAQIIVEAGANFIVTGKQGINAPSVNNIVLKADEGKSAYFLFNPAVTSNRHPNATVEFTSNSTTWGSGENYSKQRFGIPTFGRLTSMTTKNGGNDVQTALSSFNYVSNKWSTFGWINVTDKEENLDKMANPFEYYQMQHNTPNAGTIVTMTGELYGNESPDMAVRGNSWNGYANSFMAPINAEVLIALLPDGVEESFQIYELPTVAGKKGHWEAVSLMEMEDIKPMQAFLLKNPDVSSEVIIDYAEAVYNPCVNGLINNAPARRRAKAAVTYSGKAKVTLTSSNNQTCNAVIGTSDNFVDGLNPKYYATLNDEDKEVLVYVEYEGERYAHFGSSAATMKNMPLVIKTNNATSYTFSFSQLVGAIDIYDTQAGANIDKSQDYNFTISADHTNAIIADRFIINYEAPTPQNPYVAHTNIDGYASYSSDIDLTLPDGMKAYVGAISDEELVLSEVDYIKANQGVIVYAEANTDYTFTPGAGNSIYPDNDLKPSSAWTGAANNIYCLHNEGVAGTTAFYPYKGSEMPANKAFLVFPEVSGQSSAPRRISFRFDTPTDIDNVTSDMKVEKFMENGQLFIKRGDDLYNLQGQIVK